TGGNETLVETALGDSHLDIPEAVTPQAVHELFRSARKAAAGRPAAPAGPGARRKGEFALALPAHLPEAPRPPPPGTRPPPVARRLGRASGTSSTRLRRRRRAPVPQRPRLPRLLISRMPRLPPTPLQAAARDPPGRRLHASSGPAAGRKRLYDRRPYHRATAR